MKFIRIAAMTACLLAAGSVSKAQTIAETAGQSLPTQQSGTAFATQYYDLYVTKKVKPCPRTVKGLTQENRIHIEGWLPGMPERIEKAGDLDAMKAYFDGVVGTLGHCGTGLSLSSNVVPHPIAAAALKGAGWGLKAGSVVISSATGSGGCLAYPFDQGSLVDYYTDRLIALEMWKAIEKAC